MFQAPAPLGDRASSMRLSARVTAAGHQPGIQAMHGENAGKPVQESRPQAEDAELGLLVERPASPRPGGAAAWRSLLGEQAGTRSRSSRCRRAARQGAPPSGAAGAERLTSRGLGAGLPAPRNAREAGVQEAKAARRRPRGGLRARYSSELSWPSARQANASRTPAMVACRPAGQETSRGDPRAAQGRRRQQPARCWFCAIWKIAICAVSLIAGATKNADGSVANEASEHVSVGAAVPLTSAGTSMPPSAAAPGRATGVRQVATSSFADRARPSGRWPSGNR